jgi:hypothetical protein
MNACFKERKMTFANHRNWLRLTALICTALLVPGDFRMYAQQPVTGAETLKLKSPEQLDSLVAPLALYPDPLLAQSLAASTYPLEIVQAARWLKQNSSLTGEALTKAAAKQPWDPSIQAMVAFPDVLNLLDKNVQWTQELGNAFLDQQSDVMDAIQRMRMKAKNNGKLGSNKEQKVEVKTIESKTIIEIQPANPQVIYVPSYDPVVVYGAPVYAYPPVVYPYGAIAATAAVSFGVGVMMGAFWGGCCGGGGWGWNAGWSNNNININNNFNNRYGYNNINGGNRNQINGGNRGNIGNGSGNANWKHNSDHRRSVPYGNRETAQRFNGTTRDQSGRTQRFDGRSGAGDRSGVADRGPANRMQSGSGGSSGVDRIGNRGIDSGGRSNSALGSSGSGARSRAASDRGFSSSRSGGGGFGGGGGRSGGGRSGGGRRR